MQLVVLGLNHKTVPVEIREKFSLTEEEVYIGLKSIDDYEKFREMTIISTCNRTEVYAVIEETHDALLFLKVFLYDLVGYEEGIDEYLYFYTGRDCIRHLFRVSASLDSLVVGEGQILSQVKKAYAIAREADATSTILNTLFHRSISVGKRVRTETKIAHSAVSVSSAAVELAKSIFPDFTNLSAMMIGAGKMGELTVGSLKGRGCEDVYVANRDFKKAQKLAQKVGAIPIVLENILEFAEKIDVIITSTGATYYIITKEDVNELMLKRNGKPIIFIDIAVPRDVEPQVADIEGVSLYNIDDLEAVVNNNIEIRDKEAVLAEKIIEEEVKSLLDRFHYLSIQPVIALLTNRAERMRERELKRAMAKLPDITLEQRRVIENMSRMIVRKMLREPMVKVNNAAGTKNEEYYVEAMRRLFKLDTIRENVNERENNNWHSV